MSECIPTRSDLWLGYRDSVFRKSAQPGISSCEQSSFALRRAKVGFVPQFVSGHSAALQVEDLPIAIGNPLAKSFDT